MHAVNRLFSLTSHLAIIPIDAGWRLVKTVDLLHDSQGHWL